MGKRENGGSPRFDVSVLSANIRKYRILRGLTQTELAQKLFVTPQAISNWERGMSIPDLSRFYGLTQVLAVSADRLIGVRTGKV